MADFSAVRQEECREAKLPDGCVLGASRTVVLQSVLNEIKEHGRSSMHMEVCGVLVGSLCWDGGPYLLIDGRIEGKHASHQSGSVTFTSETWDFIHEELAGKHPGRIIVGWYHTHPGFGIFLSNMDAFIHENFFSFPWEPAYVFDPQAESDGFFFKNGTELVQEDVCVSADAAPSVKEAPLRFSGQDRIVVEDKPRRRRRYVFVGIAAVALVCCAVAGVAALMEKVWKTEQIAKAAETKAEALSGALAEKDGALAEKDVEIRRHRQAEEEWGVRQETYEKEIAGLRIKVTRITTERKDLEASNKEKQSEIERLKAKRAGLEKEIRDREAQISGRSAEIGRIKTDLDSTREQKRQLELRIKELEENALRAEKAREPAPGNASPPKEAPRPEASAKDESHWYSWLMFWN